MTRWDLSCANNWCQGLRLLCLVLSWLICKRRILRRSTSDIRHITIFNDYSSCRCHPTHARGTLHSKSTQVCSTHPLNPLRSIFEVLQDYNSCQCCRLQCDCRGTWSIGEEACSQCLPCTCSTCLAVSCPDSTRDQSEFAKRVTKFKLKQSL